MSPSRRGRRSVCAAVSVALLVLAPAAMAQSIDDARQSLDLVPDPIERSPRLLGMGRLSLVIDEPNNHLTLWDYARMPAGILEADSISVVEIRPATSAASTIRDIGMPGAGGQRQNLAVRDVTVGYEAWRRSSDQTAFGLVGDVGMLRTDEPFDDASERRFSFSRPKVVPTINGRMPLIFQDRMRYGVRFIYAFEEAEQQFRSIVDDGIRQSIDKDGELLGPRNLFVPLKLETTTIGGGGSVRYVFGPLLTAGAGVDLTSTEMNSENTGVRNAALLEEVRPMSVGQATLLGKIGQSIEWIVDGRGWQSSSEVKWRFTVSAGQGTEPLAGRGTMLERDEEGSTLRSRLRWMWGDFELGGTFNTAYRQIEVAPPPASDPLSFNRFRNEVFARPGADSLFLPDSIVVNTSERRAWSAGGGASWRVPYRSLLVGVEYHYAEDRFDQDLSGAGPSRRVWDVRAGVELPLNEVLVARAGYVYRDDDRDTFTLNNEFLSNSATVGFGIGPAGATWRLEAGYAFEWIRGDFADPGQTRGDRNQLAAQVRWTL